MCFIAVWINGSTYPLSVVPHGTVHLDHIVVGVKGDGTPWWRLPTNPDHGGTLIQDEEITLKGEVSVRLCSSAEAMQNWFARRRQQKAARHPALLAFDSVSVSA